MASSIRQTTTSLLPSSKCLRHHLLVPAQRRCLNQAPERQTVPEPTTTGRSYRPVRLRPVAPFPIKAQKPFTVNQDPGKLDAMYQKLLGGDLGISDEVKWQAVTHKSFDHGWQPYNEKLAIFGNRILLMQTSLYLLNTRPEALGPPKIKKADPSPAPAPATEDNTLKRFTHPDYKYLTYINRRNVREILDPKKLGDLAFMLGIPQVMRWKPAHNNEMALSGQTNVAIECLYGIIGAIALQKGGDLAARVVKDKILAVIEKGV